MALPNRRAVYRSGHWEIDLVRRELRAKGTPIGVRGLAFEIIEVLVKAAGELVTKQELFNTIWAGTSVGENTLNVHISGLRKALGSDRGMIKTIAGRGFRLLGNWTTATDDLVDISSTAERARLPIAQPTTNLPTLAEELIGRTAAVQRLIGLVTANRMITLTGAGGIGKTVLALEVARGLLQGFNGDCRVVGLASLSNPELVASAAGSRPWHRVERR